jgi:hypothetical protein
MSLAPINKSLPLWGRRPEGPVGGVVGRPITPPTVGCADTSPTGGGF